MLALGSWACASPPPAPPAPIGPSSDQLAGQLEATYARWSERDVQQHCAVYLAACADAFARQAGFDPASVVEPNPRALVPNPDPEWIPGWDSLPTAPEQRHIAFEALAYAASQRASRRACEAEFLEVLAKRADDASTFAIEAAAVGAQPSLYERIGRLVALRSELRRGVADPVGALYHVELALWRSFEDANLGYLWRAQEQRSGDVSALRPALEADVELDLHCLDRGLPSWQDQRDELSRHVRPALSDERRAHVLGRAKHARDLETRLPASDPGLLPKLDAGAPRLGVRVQLERNSHGAPLYVRSIGRPKSGTGHVVELVGSVDHAEVVLECKPSTRIERVEPDGKVRYEEDCRRGPRRDEVVVRVALPELPQRPELAVGDQVVVAGSVVAANEKITSARPRPVLRRELELESAVIIEIWRDKMLLANFFFQ